VIKLLVFNQN